MGAVGAGGSAWDGTGGSGEDALQLQVLAGPRPAPCFPVTVGIGDESFREPDTEELCLGGMAHLLHPRLCGWPSPKDRPWGAPRREQWERWGWQAGEVQAVTGLIPGLLLPPAPSSWCNRNPKRSRLFLTGTGFSGIKTDARFCFPPGAE